MSDPYDLLSGDFPDPSTFPVPVILSDPELCIIRDWAKIRSLGARRDGRRNHYDKPAGDWFIDFLGILGEFAVSKFFGVPYAPCFDTRGDADRGDVVLWSGARIEVKYTSRQYGDFMVPNNPLRFGVELGVLTWPIDNTRGADPAVDLEPWRGVYLAGWITRDRFLRIARPKHRTGINREYLAVNANELSPIAALVETLEMAGRYAR